MANRISFLGAERGPVAVGTVALVAACEPACASILDPKGPVALAERDLMGAAFLVMLIVVVPVLVMAAVFAWRYRASNARARYAPDWAYSVRIDAVIWLVPALIVVTLAWLVWSTTHRLDPYRRLDPARSALEVEVVAQDWKWLFIYPEEGIAVVNQLVFPSATPLSLRITSDTVMNSFFMPALGGQIYAMAGMQTRLNLLADQPGRFTGRNTQYSGGGFSDQHFQAAAVSPAEFDAWLAKVRESPSTLNAEAYRALAVPSRGHPVTHYAAVEAGLFDSIIAKYTTGGSARQADDQSVQQTTGRGALHSAGHGSGASSPR
ncbi:MAG: ubiquinol oxidase subunit II [Hyphomicrobiales bacterium]|nr:ubiquinol oxidase subunit II [Hyphomicrobiales bacterium]